MAPDRKSHQPVAGDGLTILEAENVASSLIADSTHTITSGSIKIGLIGHRGNRRSSGWAAIIDKQQRIGSLGSTGPREP